MSELFEPINKATISWKNGIPYSVDYEDFYFSENSREEAHYNYIVGNGLIERWQQLPVDTTSHFYIGEIGFGSGLNFVLTWFLWLKHAPKAAHLHYISCELNPFSVNDLQQCYELWPELHLQLGELLESYPVLTPGMHRLEFEKGSVSLHLMLGDALTTYRQLLVCGDFTLERKLRKYFIDAWFLNGFSLNKNPGLWSKELFSILALLSHKGTTLCGSFAVDTVILNLESSGFQSYRVKGYNTKAQALRANYVGDVYTRCIRLTPWHVQPTSDFSTQEAIVIGAGLAGCFIAHALAKRGWKIKLLDASDKPGSGASAIRQAVLYPKFSAYRSPLLEFMLSAYLYAGPVYKRLISEFNIGQLSGMLQLAYNPREARSQARIADWLKHYPELGELVDSEGASELLGILVYQQGLFIPDSGWVDSHALCQVLMAHPNIEWCPNTDISALSYEKELWRAGEHEAETVVIANGYSLNQFSQTEHLPIKKIRGQMTAIQATEKSTSLKIPVCADVHILPAIQGQHLLGASYHPGNASVDIVPHDDADNIRKLNTLASEPIWAGTVLNSWVGVRGAFPDYLPVVGPIAHADLFKLRLAGMATDSNRWIPTTGVFYPGLYACAGFGSRGLTTIPLSTEWLAGLINREPSCLSRSLEQAISPARFLMREIIRKPQEIS